MEHDNSNAIHIILDNLLLKFSDKCNRVNMASVITDGYGGDCVVSAKEELDDATKAIATHYFSIIEKAYDKGYDRGVIDGTNNR